MKKKHGDIIILHMCTINNNPMMYGPWDMEHDGQNFCHLDHFFPFYLPPPLKAKKSKFWKNEKKKPRGIAILHKCTKNRDHMLHCYWDTMHDKCNYFLFWAVFCPLTPLTTQKIKIKKKKRKKYLEISSFYTCVPKIMTTWCIIKTFSP